MNHVDIARKITSELVKYYDEVAVLINHTDKVMVKLWNTEPSIVQSWHDTEINVRLAKSGRLMVLGLTTNDPLRVIEVASRIHEYADKIEVSEIYAPLPDDTKCSPLTDLFDKAVVEKMDDPSSLVEYVIEGAMSQGVDRVAGTITLGKTTRTLVTSKGFECSENKTSVTAYARAFKGEYSGHWAYGSAFIDPVKIRMVGERAGEYATITSSKVDITPGTYNVVISPLVAGNLFNYVARMASALFVLMGFSFFAKYKPGEKIASEQLSIIDKPRDRLLHEGAGFDDEGVETRDKAIIDKGVFKTLLFNTGVAQKLGAKSTGNAGWFSPRPWNIEIPPGELDEAELIRELRDGLVITNNWYTRLQNYYEGVFSTVSRDTVLVVRNGEIIGHAGRVRLASSFPRLLASIQAMSKTTYDIHWWEVSIPTRTPFLLIKDVTITKPEV